jgi:hypothetical protein
MSSGRYFGRLVKPYLFDRPAKASFEGLSADTAVKLPIARSTTK